VGIANDVEMLGVADLRADECRAGACDFEVYRPLTQYQRLGQHGVAIRTTGDPLMLVQPVREIMRAMDPEIPVPTPESGPGRIRTTLQEQRFVLRVMAAFTVLAVVLAAIGVYGVLAYGVARRTREFGVRMALGANARDILEDVLRRAASYALIGIALGVLGALASGRIVRSMLVDVSATDPIALGTAAATLGMVAISAALLPALRALRIRPLDALRVE
jgi:predicted lysophospholipase L1 biosynthesis ABC-type transport system permease subunit